MMPRLMYGWNRSWRKGLGRRRKGKWLRDEICCNNLSPKKCNAFCNAEPRFERFCAFLTEVGDPVRKLRNRCFSLYFCEKWLGCFRRLKTKGLFESYLRSHSFL
jgi:hypothetical protein